MNQLLRFMQKFITERMLVLSLQTLQKTRAKTTFYRGLPGAEADDGHLEAVAHLYQGGHLALKVETYVKSESNKIESIVSDRRCPHCHFLIASVTYHSIEKKNIENMCNSTTANCKTVCIFR